MPSCFQLISKETKEAVVLSKLDDELCAYFKEEPDPVRYYCGWFDSIGYRVAAGLNFEKIKEEYQKYIEEDGAAGKTDSVEYYKRLIEILDYIAERYTTDSWRESKF